MKKIHNTVANMKDILQYDLAFACQLPFFEVAHDLFYYDIQIA